MKFRPGRFTMSDGKRFILGIIVVRSELFKGMFVLFFFGRGDRNEGILGSGNTENKN